MKFCPYIEKGVKSELFFLMLAMCDKSCYSIKKSHPFVSERIPISLSFQGFHMNLEVAKAKASELSESIPYTTISYKSTWDAGLSLFSDVLTSMSERQVSYNVRKSKQLKTTGQLQQDYL